MIDSHIHADGELHRHHRKTMKTQPPWWQKTEFSQANVAKKPPWASGMFLPILSVVSYASRQSLLFLPSVHVCSAVITHVPQVQGARSVQPDHLPNCPVSSSATLACTPSPPPGSRWLSAATPSFVFLLFSAQTSTINRHLRSEINLHPFWRSFWRWSAALIWRFNIQIRDFMSFFFVLFLNFALICLKM